MMIMFMAICTILGSNAILAHAHQSPLAQLLYEMDAERESKISIFRPCKVQTYQYMKPTAYRASDGQEVELDLNYPILVKKCVNAGKLCDFIDKAKYNSMCVEDVGEVGIPAKLVGSHDNYTLTYIQMPAGCKCFVEIEKQKN